MSSLLGMTRGYTGGGRVSPYKYRGGGRVGNTDTVPAMLTPGEVVLNAGQQQRLGAAVGVPSGALFGAAGVPGFQGGGMVPESTAHNAMDMLMMQNEMGRIAQENQQYGAMRQYDPWSDPRSQELQNTLLEMVTGGYNPGAVVGMAEVAGGKTISRMIKDLTMRNASIEQMLKPRLLGDVSKFTRSGGRIHPKDAIAKSLNSQIDNNKTLLEYLKAFRRTGTGYGGKPTPGKLVE